MNEGGNLFSIDGKFAGVLNWISRLLYLQVIWVLFCIIGLLIGGIFPATFAMFGIIRIWIREEKDIQIYKKFSEMYKESFVKTNILGWLMVLFGFSNYFYLNWFSSMTGAISLILISGIVFISLAFLMTSLFVMPVYVHYDVGLLKVVRFAATIAVTHPLHILGMVITIISFWYFMIVLPIIFLFIGMSLLVFILMNIANAAFVSIERKLET